MNREIKFRAWEGGKMIYEKDISHISLENSDILRLARFWCNIRNDAKVMQYTGLKDKNGKEIYEGDEVRIRQPYRTTQTHTGDNIPNGSYTEPLEAGIKTSEGVIVFHNGCFCLDDTDNNHEPTPLWYYDTQWDLKMIEDAISYGRPDRFIFDDPEEGDLQYLIEEVAKVKDSDELIKYLSGIEVIGSIYENHESLNNNN